MAETTIIPPKIPQKIEKVAKDLHINLPEEALSLPLRIVTLLMLVGGIGILGNVFTDFVAPDNTNFGSYVVRLIGAAAFLAVAYGLYRRERWSVWLYGAIVCVGLIFNFALALLPAALVGYLYYKRRELRPGILDKHAAAFLTNTKERMRDLFNRNSR